MSIRDLDDGVRDRLRIRAAQHGRSMEAEARAIITDAVGGASDDLGFIGTLMARVAEIGGVELDIPARTGRQREIDFSG